jgi:hypothetical protein
MTQAHLIADGLISIAAIAGLMVLVGVLRRSGPADALTRRFILGLAVLIVFLSGRLLWWLTGSGFFLTFMLIAAGLIPLATIILAEGLLRRHAPPAIKYGILLATTVFSVLAFLPSPLIEPVRAYLLLGFQFVSFLAVGWMVVRRDRASLAPRENWLIDRIALSLLLILPFLVTDFRFEGFQMPVRMAGIAILFTCWLAVGMGRSELGHRETVKSFVVLATAAVLGGIGIGLITEMDLTGTVQAIAVVLAACLVAAIFIDSLNLKTDERRHSLLYHIAHGTEANAATFLRNLREHMLVDGALMLGPDDLVEFDLAALEAVFAADPVRHIGEARGKGLDAGMEQLAALFERYEITHIMLVSREPLTLVALNMPALATTPGAETELRAVQRVASLISERRNG